MDIITSVNSGEFQSYTQVKEEQAVFKKCTVSYLNDIAINYPTLISIEGGTM